MDQDLARTETVYRPPSSNDTARVSAGQRALEAEHARLLEMAGAAVNVARYSFHYAARVIEMDDDQGRRAGWVGRYDEVRWSDLVTVAIAGAKWLDEHGDPAHRGQCTSGWECTTCELTRALGRIRQSTEVAIRAGVPIRGGAADRFGGQAGPG